ncbi:MAG: FHA domain-containing protein, partial [Myxococcota bacterium]
DERAAPSLVRHGVALFGSPPRRPWGRLIECLATGGIRDIRHLWKDEIIIGREDGDILYRDDAFLSRRHAVLTQSEGRCMLQDLDSSNGTFLRLRGPAAVGPGDHLRLGDQLVRFELPPNE